MTSRSSPPPSTQHTLSSHFIPKNISDFPLPRLIGCKGESFVLFAERSVRVLNCELHGTSYLGFGSYINSGFIRSYVEVGRYCSIGRNVTIGLGRHDYENITTSPFFGNFDPVDNLEWLAKKNPKRRVIVGNDVWIGDNVLIDSGVTIGNGAVIAAGAVVTKNVPSFTIVGGIPAKVIKHRFDNDLASALNQSEWWSFRPHIIAPMVRCNDALKMIDQLAMLDSTCDLFSVDYLKIRKYSA